MYIVRVETRDGARRYAYGSEQQARDMAARSLKDPSCIGVSWFAAGEVKRSIESAKRESV